MNEEEQKKAKNVKKKQKESVYYLKALHHEIAK